MTIEEIRGCGIGCGKGCSGFALFLAWIYLLGSLTLTLLCRLYLKAYYAGANMAAMAFLIGLYVVTHHSGKMRKTLGLKIRAYTVIQIILNSWYFFACLAAGGGYTALTVLAYHLQFDYLAAALFAWVNAVFMLYLLVLVIGACRNSRFEAYSIDKQNGFSNGGTHIAGEPESGCCKSLCRGLFWIGYILTHIVLMVVFVLVAYYPYASLQDVVNHRSSQDKYMTEVELEGYRPLSQYIKCNGPAINTGKPDIVFEHDIGIPTSLLENFIPKELSSKNRVCFADRRGYGWSENFESDYGENILNTKQWPETNIAFLKQLVNKTQISTPFYYIGHGYGGYHLVHLALENPEMIKGMVFLSSYNFGEKENSLGVEQEKYVKFLKDYGELLVNFQYLGLQHLSYSLTKDLLDDFFSDLINFRELTTNQMNQFYSSYRSAYYLTSTVREYTPVSDASALDLLQDNLKNKTIDLPVLVIDADDATQEWFPRQYFSRYDNTTHRHQITGANHFSLALSLTNSSTVATLIQSFIDNNP